MWSWVLPYLHLKSLSSFQLTLREPLASGTKHLFLICSVTPVTKLSSPVPFKAGLQIRAAGGTLMTRYPKIVCQANCSELPDLSRKTLKSGPGLTFWLMAFLPRDFSSWFGTTFVSRLHLSYLIFTNSYLEWKSKPSPGWSFLPLPIQVCMMKWGKNISSQEELLPLAVLRLLGRAAIPSRHLHPPRAKGTA